MQKYAGVEYLELGRGFLGADCYGLIILWYRHELGIELLDCFYSSVDEATDLGLLISNVHNDFVEVPISELRKHDIVLINVKDRPSHCGVMFDDKTLMQMTKFNFVSTKLSRVTRSIHSAYRHRSLIDDNSTCAEHI